MGVFVLVCGTVFDGVGDELMARREILVRNGRILELAESVSRPDDAELVDLSERTVSPGFIDTHVHLTMDASNLALQTLQSSAAKALRGLEIAREYMHYGFTTLHDPGSVDPEFPTVDLRNALDRGLLEGPRLVVAAHIISSTGGHGDLSAFYASRYDLPVSALADSAGEIRRLVRREHASGSDWIKTSNAGGYFSVGDDPARGTWHDDEMDALTSTARLLGMPVAVHTGAAEACKQVVQFGARSLEPAYLIDEEGVEAARDADAYIVPTMQMTQEDLGELHAGTLPCQAVWKFGRDNQQILDSQRLVAASDAKIAFATDCGRSPSRCRTRGGRRMRPRPGHARRAAARSTSASPAARRSTTSPRRTGSPRKRSRSSRSRSSGSNGSRLSRSCGRRCAASAAPYNQQWLIERHDYRTPIEAREHLLTETAAHQSVRRTGAGGGVRSRDPAVLVLCL